MKKTIGLMVCLAFLATTSTVAFAAGDHATPSEVVQKVNEAVALIQKKGEAAFDTFRDKKGPFVWKGSYLFVQDIDGNMLMHPYNRRLEGRNMMGVKDARGKLFTAEQVAIAKSPSGQGWVDYWWVKPGEKTASPKVSFIERVPGTKYFVGAGIFDMTKQEAENAVK
jgi:cytochrome c